MFRDLKVNARLVEPEENGSYFGGSPEESIPQLQVEPHTIVFVRQDDEGGITTRAIPWNSLPSSMHIKFDSLMSEIEAYAWKDIVIGGV